MTIGGVKVSEKSIEFRGIISTFLDTESANDSIMKVDLIEIHDKHFDKFLLSFKAANDDSSILDQLAQTDLPADVELIYNKINEIMINRLIQFE